MGKILIDKERCKSCRICMSVCPKKLIQPADDVNAKGFHFAQFNDENNECIGCAMCAHSCPDVAIVKVFK